MARLYIQGIANYVTLEQPRAFKAGDKPKYSLMLMIPDSDTERIKKIEDKISEASGNPYQVSELDIEGMVGIKSSSGFCPKLFDSRGKSVTADIFYSGCEIEICINPVPFKIGRNEGTAIYLQAVKFIKDGEALTTEFFDDEEYETL